MSRIKGGYFFPAHSTHPQDWRERWLDPATGITYPSATGDRDASLPFSLRSDGAWKYHPYSSGPVFIPDAAPELAADWYVLRVVPDEYQNRPPREGGYPPVFTAFGPYTEAEARANAAKRSEMSAGKSRTATPKPYAVVQVQAGNTVVVRPPAPPAAVAHWS